MVNSDDDFETRAIEVLFNGGDESLLTEGEVYELYDSVTEYVKANYGEITEDFHFTGSSLPQNNKVLH
jgi:hypothetical protein